MVNSQIVATAVTPIARHFRVIRMIGIIIPVLAIFFPGILSAQIDPEFVGDTRSYLSRLEKLGFAGSVLISAGGEVVLGGGYGDARRDPSAPWTTGTVSTIGSITKQFTAAAIMRLQEQGRLRVDDTLDKHFKDVPPDKASITLHQLLSHSSGIADPQGMDDFDENTRDEYVRLVLDTPLIADPGTHYEYANANFSLLGAIMEQITGASYEQALHDLIFKPAGLELTGYTMPVYSGRTVAEGYVGDERWGTILERPMAEDGPFWALRANGGIHSTAEEMVKWGQVLLDNKVLSRESCEAMWTGHIDESNNDEGESFYGYGWVVLEPAPGLKVITHNGGNRVLFADMMIVPSAGIVAIVQTNVISTFPATNQLLEQVMYRMHGEPYPDVPIVVDMDAESIRHWSGTYTLDNNNRFEMSVDGNTLLVTPHGWLAYAVVHSIPGQDTAPLLEKCAEIDRIVGAIVDGDFQPIYEAYGGQVPLEQLEDVYKERAAEREAEYGELLGYEVLGTGTGEQFHFTPVRFRHKNETIIRTYVWSREEKSGLLGVAHRSTDSACRFFPVDGGGFQSWEPATGASVTTSFSGDANGASFVVKRDTGEVSAQR